MQSYVTTSKVSSVLTKPIWRRCDLQQQPFTQQG